jgi:protein gp37
MCDLFEDHPVANDYRPEVWQMYRNTPYLDWIILTKRPERIVECPPEDWGNGYPNVWLGVTIECQNYAGRADSLKKIPAVVRFISYEPALGPLKLDLTGIDWVIYGGESGPGFRPHDIQWAKDMRAACESSGTVFFYKQSSALKQGEGADALGEIVREFPVPRGIIKRNTA